MARGQQRQHGLRRGLYADPRIDMLGRSVRLRQLGMQAYGLLPFPMHQEDEDRMHGNDERIPLASLDFGTRLMFGAVHRVAR